MDLDASFDELLRLSEKGWKHRIGHDPLTPPTHRAFFKDLARELREAGMLSLCAIELDGEKIAFDLSFRMRGTFFAYYTVFDESIPDLSPGKMLVAHMIEDSFARGVSEINLSDGEEEHKLEWTSSCRHYKEAYLLNRKSRLFLPLLVSLSLRKRRKGSPLLRDSVEKAKDLIRGR
jgi:CelD/BcsL family acetyltransferase involved in cellulose biosynthesis